MIAWKYWVTWVTWHICWTANALQTGCAVMICICHMVWESSRIRSEASPRLCLSSGRTCLYRCFWAVSPGLPPGSWVCQEGGVPLQLSSWLLCFLTHQFSVLQPLSSVFFQLLGKQKTSYWEKAPPGPEVQRLGSENFLVFLRHMTWDWWYLLWRPPKCGFPLIVPARKCPHLNPYNLWICTLRG